MREGHDRKRVIELRHGSTRNADSADNNTKANDRMEGPVFASFWDDADSADDSVGQSSLCYGSERDVEDVA